ncbi:MAG: hypothetical protein KDD48_06555 [Bdellovibrionales bacterium]|nr:hypothetical protein [Bdellovibrionales bacterium]
MKVRLYENVFPSQWFSHLNKCLRKYSKQTDRIDGAFWYSFKGSPTNLFEQLIRYLRKIARPGSECIGAEWWVHSYASDWKKNFHFDRDEYAYLNTSKWIHPKFGSIVYVSDSGGPTVILDQRVDPKKGLIPEQAKKGTLIYPKKNQFAIFAGNLRHGVYPAEFQSKNGSNRITFLINWWHRKPINLFPLTKALPAFIAPLPKAIDSMSAKDSKLLRVKPIFFKTMTHS